MASPRRDDDVGGNERDFPLVRLGEIAGGAVQVDGELAGRLRIEQLREPGGDHAGQHVAGAAGRHAGVAGEVDEGAVLGAGDDRAVSLEDDVDACAAANSRAMLEAIALDLLDRRVRAAAPSRRDAA